MSEWADVTLGDVLTLQRGFDLPKRLRKPGPYPVISSAGVTGHHDESKVEPPGVVIGRTGSLGSVHWVEKPFWPLNTSLWVKDFKGNDPRYTAYLLQTLEIANSSTAAVPGVNRNHLHTLPVRLPPLADQRRIAPLLAVFDDLIAINERRIEILETSARALYQERFGRFRVPGEVETPLTDSTIGPIPQGWSVGRVGDYAEVVNDGVDPSEFDSEEPYVGLEHLPRRRTTLRSWGSAASVSSRKLRFAPGDTLFGKIRPNLHKVAWAPFSGLASSDTIILRPKKGRSLAALLNALASSDRFVAEAVATSNGTKMPRADAKALLAYEIPVPGDGELLAAFDRTVRPWLDWSAELARLNHRFSKTRDLLLPRLIGGHLDISDVDLGVLAPAEDG